MPHANMLRQCQQLVRTPNAIISRYNIINMVIIVVVSIITNIRSLIKNTYITIYINTRGLQKLLRVSNMDVSCLWWKPQPVWLLKSTYYIQLGADYSNLISFEPVAISCCRFTKLFSYHISPIFFCFFVLLVFIKKFLFASLELISVGKVNLLTCVWFVVWCEWWNIKFFEREKYKLRLELIQPTSAFIYFQSI